MWKWLLLAGFVGMGIVATIDDEHETTTHVQEDQAIGGEVFYLDVKQGGCYVFAAYKEEPVPIELLDDKGDSYKHLKEVSCSDLHHFEVINVLKMQNISEIEYLASNSHEKLDEVQTTNTPIDPIAVDDGIAQDICIESYVMTFDKSPPVDATSNGTYLRWFYSDSGLKGGKYKGIIICYIHEADESHQIYKLMKRQSQAVLEKKSSFKQSSPVSPKPATLISNLNDSDFVSKYVGSWAGQPGWDCDDPFIIQADRIVRLGNGPEAWVLDQSHELLHSDDEDGQQHLVYPEDGKLIFFSQISGDTFTLERCQ